MSFARKKSLLKLKSIVNSDDKSAENLDFNSFKRLCEIFLANPEPKKRERALRKYINNHRQLQSLIENNEDLLAFGVEQALIKLATGYTVTERRIKTTNRGRFTEEVEREVPPNPKAVEFFLTNAKPDKYSQKPEANSANSEGRINELLEALKNVK